MELNSYITFLLLSFMLIIIPGPNVLVIVSTSVMHGKRRGLQTVAGTTLAMAIQLIIAGLSTTWLIRVLADGFYILKWLGVAYLLYLGIKHLMAALQAQNKTFCLTASASFSRGFFVSLSNPKTIVFFSAFLPQFVVSTESYVLQITILSLTFLLLATVLDSCYAILSSRCKTLLEKYNIYKLQNGIAGLFYLGVSAWMAVSRRT